MARGNPKKNRKNKKNKIKQKDRFKGAETFVMTCDVTKHDIDEDGEFDIRVESEVTADGQPVFDSTMNWYDLPEPLADVVVEMVEDSPDIETNSFRKVLNEWRKQIRQLVRINNMGHAFLSAASADDPAILDDEDKVDLDMNAEE